MWLVRNLWLAKWNKNSPATVLPLFNPLFNPSVFHDCFVSWWLVADLYCAVSICSFFLFALTESLCVHLFALTVSHDYPNGNLLISSIKKHCQCDMMVGLRPHMKHDSPSSLNMIMHLLIIKLLKHYILCMYRCLYTSSIYFFIYCMHCELSVLLLFAT